MGRRLRTTIPVLAVAFTFTGAFASCRAATRGPLNVNVGPSTYGRPIQPGFVGLSIEYPSLISYAGSDSTALNPVFEQLVRNLAPGQRPVLRIGGDSSDWAWWPTPGVARPGGIRYTLTDSWLAVGRALSAALNPQLILGINLEADSGQVAQTMASELAGGLGRAYIAGVELGNEPELYGAFAYYTTPAGHKVRGRPRGWTFTDYLKDFSTIVRALPALPLIGPSIGSPAWMVNLRKFLRAQPHTSLVTVHRYPLKHCTDNAHLTVAELMSDDSSRGLADSVARYVALAHAKHIPLRVDEMNSISCGGQRGLSGTFATSLWVVDAMFEMARVGVDGVNIHSSPLSLNELFQFQRSNGGWSGDVHAMYYGMLMFAQAAPGGSRLLRLSAPRTGSPMKIWATRATDGTVRITAINRGPHTTMLHLRAPAPGSSATPPTVTRLRGPSFQAETGITLGGQTFGSQTSTGTLTGPPSTETLVPASGTYRLTLPPRSAALLTIRH
jgi:hypothetical protein